MTLLFDDNGVTLTAASNGVLTLLMDRTQNVFNPALVQSLHKALDKVDTIQPTNHNKSLIVTAKGKFFSNGLDLNFLQNHTQNEVSAMIEGVWRVLARVLVMDCRTVAAINGHAFGAGLFLALACDYRIMRTDRGYLNFPELNLGMRLAKGFSELSKAKVFDGKTLREGVLTGKRYASRDAVQAGLIDQECPVNDLLQKATEMAVAGFPENLGAQFFNPEMFRSMKMELYTDAYRALTLGTMDALPQSRL